MNFPAARFLVFLGSSLFTAGPARAAAAETIVLPPFEVNGTRPWLYAEISGLEVLSLENEKDTHTIVERWQRAMRFKALFFPPSMPADSAVSSTLFLGHFAGDQMVKEGAAALRLPGRWSGRAVSSYDKVFELPTKELGHRWRRGAVNPLGSHLTNVLSSRHAPSWYGQALHRLLGNARVTNTVLQIPTLYRDPHLLVSLEQLFAVSTTSQHHDLLRGPRSEYDRWRATATAFTHWGFFGDSGKRRAAFLELIEIAGQRAVDDAILRQLFGLDRAAIETVLAEYVRKEHGRVHLKLPADVAARPLPRVVVRLATRVEVARISGEFYLALSADGDPAEQASYQARAATILREIYDLGVRDPQLVEQIGSLDYHQGRRAEAREAFELAISMGVPGPAAHVAVALLDLQAANDATPPPATLPDTVADGILERLRPAFALRPALAQVFLIASEVSLRRSTAPPTELLEMLTDGARKFPDDVGLLVRVATLQLRANRPDVAAGLINDAISWPGNDESARARLLKFREEKIGARDPKPHR